MFISPLVQKMILLKLVMMILELQAVAFRRRAQDVHRGAVPAGPFKELAFLLSRIRLLQCVCCESR